MYGEQCASSMPLLSQSLRKRTPSTSRSVTCSISRTVPVPQPSISAFSSSKCSDPIRPLTRKTVFSPSEVFSILSVIPPFLSKDQGQSAAHLQETENKWFLREGPCPISAFADFRRLHRIGDKRGGRPGFRGSEWRREVRDQGYSTDGLNRTKVHTANLN